MSSTSRYELVPILQMATGPVILIFGFSLFLLNLTNRFGRILDRSRVLIREMREALSSQRQSARQVAVLCRRGRLMRLSIVAATSGLLFASALIIGLFLVALLKMEGASLIVTFFICSMLSFIVSLGAFMRDIQLSLLSLELELGGKAFTPRKNLCGADDPHQMKSFRLFNV
jgi:hypothetical protein